MNRDGILFQYSLATEGWKWALKVHEQGEVDSNRWNRCRLLLHIRSLVEWSFYFAKGGIGMEKETSNKLGFLSILTIIFVIAKLFRLIRWSWLLVFAPTLIGIGLWILIMLVAIVIAAVSGE